MTPLFDRLLIKLLQSKEVKTEAGLLLATEDLEQAHEKAEVRYIGTEMKWCKVGDIITLQKKAGSPIMMDGGEVLYLIRETQVDLIN
jgi:co-chaperonin GroES (HSP10)